MHVSTHRHVVGGDDAQLQQAVQEDEEGGLVP